HPITRPVNGSRSIPSVSSVTSVVVSCSNYGFARHRGCSEDTSEEIVQEVVMAIFQRRDVFQYDPKRGRFRDWLGGMVRNKVAEHKRRPAARIRGRGGDFQSRFDEQEANDPPVDQAWEAAFEEALLGALLDIVRRETNVDVSFITLPYFEATIYIDGRQLTDPAGKPCQTPCTVDNLPGGDHRVVFKLDGHDDLDAGITDFNEKPEIVARWGNNPDLE
ncbi:MAG: PEGA domain-containing protein, partial [Pirellulales bacterium]|nr:PEGA domain-containing protein [Pirellulales bacterium]